MRNHYSIEHLKIIISKNFSKLNMLSMHTIMNMSEIFSSFIHLEQFLRKLYINKFVNTKGYKEKKDIDHKVCLVPDLKITQEIVE